MNIIKKIKTVGYVAYAGLAVISLTPVLFGMLSPSAYASPFGQGNFGAGQFGPATSISLDVGGNVNLGLSLNGGNYSGNGSHTVTVTTNDVVGYGLYAYALGSSTMTGASSTIPASTNSSAAALAVNTWGYNTDGSTNYLGMTTTPTLIRTVGHQAAGSAGITIPAATTVTYGVLTDTTKPAGNYAVSVVYTAVALSQ